MSAYKLLIHAELYQQAADYLQRLQKGVEVAGELLKLQLKQRDLSLLSPQDLLNALLATKKPQIFAESAVYGDGRDWTRTELKLLGGINVAAPVLIYDDGRHTQPNVHLEPFAGYLLFTPGALLRNGKNHPPADFDVVKEGHIDPEQYYHLYRQRLFPVFKYASDRAGQQGKKALITVPGLGCGQFAGPFAGQMGPHLRDALHRLLSECHTQFTHIKAIYYDPYNECRNQRFDFGSVSLRVRPLLQGNQSQPQLCLPTTYAEQGDDFSDCELYSVVAWDQVSWPGNDFYTGARATDDGVKAAATSSMSVMTGVPGQYDKTRGIYQPPAPYRHWEAVVQHQGLSFGDSGHWQIITPAKTIEY
jgi:hypothetical protein